MRAVMVSASLAFALFSTQALAQMDLFAMADADADGKVTAAEFATFHEGGWAFFSNGAATIKQAEIPEFAKASFTGVKPDANGEINKDAYMAVTPALFKAADKNGDGVLDKAEFEAMMGPMPGQ